MLATLVLSSLAAAVAVNAQSSVDASIAPAATVLPTDSTNAGIPLFAAEATQLTDDVVASLANDSSVADVAHLFAFGDETEANATASARKRASGCKTYPGDALWPSQTVWKIFDLLLGGALQEIVPIASPCYPNSEYNDYNQTQCASITAGWNKGVTHYSDPGSVMFPMYEGKTCLPGTDPTALGTCTQGGYALLSVKATNVAQIQLAVNFARALNLRLVVKNTGHDYNGRSTGKNALSIWTHNLKGIQYVKSYKSKAYSGPVFKVGSGVMGFELYEAAEKYGVSAVGGICPTVGIFGGYSAGGGHSPLMQFFGVGSDQIVAMEVVTPDGRFITVSPEKNSDLYWAMCGGGGGTFGIVTSAIVKVHPKMPVTTSVFNFTSASVGAETFWKGVEAFWDDMPAYNEAKTYSYFFLSNSSGTYSFEMFPFFATNKTIAEFEELTKPFFDKLTALGISYKIATAHYDTFYGAYQATFNTIDSRIGGYTSIPGNRLIPAENWDDAKTSAATLGAVRHAVDNALRIGIYHQHPNDDAAVDNAVNPAFRNEGALLIAINFVAANATVATIGAESLQLTNDILGPLREVTPSGGTYGNEADPAEPDWQNAFWGKNYERLLQIKKKVDPTELFYVHHGVGSEGWAVDDGDRGVPTQDGKLCRT